MRDQKVPDSLRYIFSVYLTVIGFFTLFRLVIVPLHWQSFSEMLRDESGDVGLVMKAFVMGFRFDTVISCYVLALILILLMIGFFGKIRYQGYYKTIHYLGIILFSVCFLISMIDVPYFKFFFTRFTVQGLAWMDNPAFVFKMIVQESTYLLAVLLLVGIWFVFTMIMRKMYRKFLKPQTMSDYRYSQGHRDPIVIGVFLLTVALCFLGIRGRMEAKSPIRVGTAYFSNNPLINQMGLNPVFTFVKSVEEKAKHQHESLNLMDKKKAEEFVKEEFEHMYNYPIANRIPVLGTNTNVILVIMESMGSCFIGHFGNQNLTPNLDYLLKNSVSYENVYTAGMHTYNGVYSSLFGQPALMDKHTMHYTVIPQIKGGLCSLLKEKGYNTYYFTTHDDQFDNIGGFLSANGVEKIISVQDYPGSEVKSTMGVPDHVMFERVIRELNHRDKEQPFFVSILTGSNHAPYVLPDDIPLQTKSKDIRYQMIEYADWAIGKFVKDAQKEAWFENTLFVFVADHGAYEGVSPYEVALSYHHTPYVFYSPKKLTPQKVEALGLQLDTPAMIASYLGIENKETLGIPFDLYSRRYAYFSADDKLGVLDTEYLYIWNRNGQEYLYKYKVKDKVNYIKQFPEKAKEMQNYGFSMMMSVPY